jgi:hypothetical protein
VLLFGALEYVGLVYVVLLLGALENVGLVYVVLLFGALENVGLVYVVLLPGALTGCWLVGEKVGAPLLLYGGTIDGYGGMGDGTGLGTHRSSNASTFGWYDGVFGAAFLAARSGRKGNQVMTVVLSMTGHERGRQRAAATATVPEDCTAPGDSARKEITGSTNTNTG